jgi:hypothetical protein
MLVVLGSGIEFLDIFSRMELLNRKRRVGVRGLQVGAGYRLVSRVPSPGGSWVGGG